MVVTVRLLTVARVVSDVIEGLVNIVLGGALRVVAVVRECSAVVPLVPPPPGAVVRVVPAAGCVATAFCVVSFPGTVLASGAALAVHRRHPVH